MRQHRWARTRARGMSQGSLQDRKSTRLNSSHGYISYAVFCLKKKKTANRTLRGSASTDTPGAPAFTVFYGASCARTSRSHASFKLVVGQPMAVGWSMDACST